MIVPTLTQNPDKCDDTRYIVCYLRNTCGLTCQLHHLVHCLMASYASRRMLVINSTHWHYSNKAWNHYFENPSLNYGENPEKIFGSDKIFNMSKTAGDEKFKEFVHTRALPLEIFKRLEGLHGEPTAWWVGQMLSFLLKPQKWLQDKLVADEVKHHFQNPIVSIHVRRTDKLKSEASFHDISEYMLHVENYYQYLDLKQQIVDKRRVYIATDDINVIHLAIQRYPDYEILHDENVVNTAVEVNRYSDASLAGIIKDIHFLSKSDYIVCTFSSGVCRAAYEIMQTLHADASQRFRSLDDTYYLLGQPNVRYIVRLHHNPDNNELPLKTGDEIKLHGDHWDGFSLGSYLDSSEAGLFPSYKVEKVGQRGLV
ncbi:hypothetical protein HELRODRAFT_75808 [Helobdella robusta]|uniref:GT23 domain-containing protein n=1 Tax=Helobdella robusta TaxID=6412 RepID=T1G2A5_HELRO|nr:hypothetical protein HELRODRAFT_75808 [Helobdella robusta]ESO07749.1 hypothetical protein HELRODRAFT_75808 [Helobdella robusta]